ncbi:ABC transporter substrate-binding protein [Virgibacillus kimchii]
MKYMEYARILINSFHKNQQSKTTIAELANLFHCSDRHTKTIIHYLKDKKWVKWKVQQGRGKKPQLTLLYSMDDLLYEEALYKAKLEQYQEAFLIINRLDTAHREKFQSMFQHSMGISTVRTEAETSIDVLRYPFYDTDLNMDPLYSRSRHDSHMIKQIFDRLVEFNSETGELEPCLAHYWESIDGKRWIFYLRKGVMFHHGRVMTSEDVKLTILRFSKNSPIRRNLMTIEVVDDTTIVFHLENKDYLFPELLAGLGGSIVPMEVVEQEEKAFQTKPVGTGPYMLTAYNEEMIRLDIFPDYYGFRPWLDRIEIIITPEEISKKQDHPLLLDKPDTTWLEIKVREEGADYITFNCRKSGPLQEWENRQWISSVIEPREFCLKERDETVAHSFISEKSSKLSEKKKLKDPKGNKWDLKIAAQQIRAGVNHEREALILQKQLKRADVETTVDIVDVENLQNQNIVNQYDLVVAGIALSENKLLSAVTSMISNQLTIYRSLTDEMRESVDAHIAAIKETPDPEKQWALYFQLEEFLKGNACIFFLNHRTHTIYEPKNSDYENIALDSNGRVDYRRVWKRKTECYK